MTKPAKLRHWREFTAAADAFLAAHPGATAARLRAGDLVNLCDLIRHHGDRAPLFHDAAGPGLEWRGLRIYCGEHHQAEAFEVAPLTPAAP